MSGHAKLCYRLNTGDTIVSKTDMLKEEVESLSVLSNQYQFYK